MRRTDAFVCIVQRSLVAAGYRSRYPAGCPRLILHHCCCRHMLAQRHQNRHRQRWSHVLFGGESIVMLHNCNSACLRFSSCWKVSGLSHKTTAGIRGNDDQHGWSCPRTHRRKSHETSVDGSSFRIGLPTCGGSSDVQESVWALVGMSWVKSSCY